jgi:hypothetical protein
LRKVEQGRKPKTSQIKRAEKATKSSKPKKVRKAARKVLVKLLMDERKFYGSQDS